MATDYEMVMLFKEELELCAVKPGEVVTVLTEGDIRADYARCFLEAARALGANTFQLNVPNRLVREDKTLVGRTPIAGNRAVIETLKQDREDRRFFAQLASQERQKQMELQYQAEQAQAARDNAVQLAAMKPEPQGKAAN